MGSFLKFENTQKAALHRPALPIPRDTQTDRQTDRCACAGTLSYLLLLPPPTPNPRPGGNKITRLEQ